MKKVIQAIRQNRLLPLLVIAGVVVLWLAPITLLGKMPIGGDVTSFFLPLMAYYRRALLDGRIPLWNELWGFGFPGLAESQMGVFYPPHLILFSLFETETAYSMNIVLHFLLAGWFAYFCGRTFGMKPWGATLAGLIFAGNGFFIIHFPHQWSYTSGAWLPLAVALAWRVVGKVEGGGRRAEGQAGGSRIEDRGSKIENRPRGIEEGGASVTAYVWRHRARASLGLTAVLAVQMLAGHFQIAFYTQVVVLLIGLLCTMQRVFHSFQTRRNRQGTPPSTQYSVLSTQHAAAALPKPKRRQRPLTQPWGSPAALVWLAIPLAASFVLAAVQLLPTYELIRIALPDGRDFEYLSGFANTPFHLVSYLLPTLFHVNPLWRPVAWDPFHTSPEECFSYVGLLPICLAAGAAWRWRREPRVRLWVLLAVITLLLSLGPYVPGFRTLILLPGFNGFRSSSRWSLATALFLSLLAGRALDGVRATERLRYWLRGLVFAFAIVAFGAVGAALTFAGGASGSQTVLRLILATCRFVSPWPAELHHQEISARAQAASSDVRAVSALANLGYDVNARRRGPLQFTPLAEPVKRFSLAGERRRIMWQETMPPFVLLGLLWCSLAWVRSRRAPRVWVVVLVAVDLGAATWLRPADFAPRGRLAEQSPVLAFVADRAAGERVRDPFLNLLMLSGAAPAQSYRTVDIPIWQNLLTMDADTTGTMIPPDWKNLVLSRCGITWEFVDKNSALYRPDPEKEEIEFSDPLLGQIVFGPGLLANFPELVSRFAIRRVNDVASCAWFAEDQGRNQFQKLLNYATADQRRLRLPFDRHVLESLAQPLKVVRCESGLQEFEFSAHGPGAVVISQPAYPGWKAQLTRLSGGQPMQSGVSSAGCQVVPIAAAGDYRLELSFQSRAYELGLTTSGIAALVWIVLLVWQPRIRAKSRVSEKSAGGPKHR